MTMKTQNIKICVIQQKQYYDRGTRHSELTLKERKREIKDLTMHFEGTEKQKEIRFQTNIMINSEK